MTELTNEHFELHDSNKDKMFKKNKIKNALIFLNLNINQIIKLKDNGADDIYKELDTIADDLTDVFVDLKTEIGVDIWLYLEKPKMIGNNGFIINQII